MGLSNYSPSSRLSQAGVCTSSTRPASPYEGQMIYETDTDRTLVWDGSAWVNLNLDINGITEIGGDLADFDTIPVYDLSATTNRKSFMSRVATYIFGKIGGAGTISSTGTMSITQSTYLTPTYNTGWADYAGSYLGARYTKSASGIISITGMVKRTSGSDPIIFTLPVGYRPSNSLLFITAGSGGIGRVDVYSNGTVQWLASVSGTVNTTDWVSLAGIQFAL